EVASATGCDAIHPGYGFFAENAKLVRRIEETGLTFIGPSSASIALIGDKLGYPVILKPAAGGGGIGMTILHDPAGLERAYTAAARLGQAMFGSGTVYLETFLTGGRHVEIQILADHHGHALHLGE